MPITMKQTKGKPKLARVLDNKKPPIEKDDISMIKPWRGGISDPPPMAKINPAEPNLASSPNPFRAIP